MSCGVGCRCRLDPALLWRWGKLAAAALIGSLAGEPPYAIGGAVKKKKKKKERKKEKKKKKETLNQSSPLSMLAQNLV